MLNKQKKKRRNAKVQRLENNLVYSEVSNKHGVLIPKGRKFFQNQINVEVLIRHVVVFICIYYIKTVFVAGFSEIDKRGCSNKACSSENFLKKIRKTPCLLETSEYCV